MNNKFSQVVRIYRAEQGMTLEQMAEALREQMEGTMFGNLSRQAIGLWERGTLPNVIFLIRASRVYDDWRREFALDALAALEPELFQPVGEIGREVLAGVVLVGVDHRLEGMVALEDGAPGRAEAVQA